jgi:hypothetical protein
LSHLAYPPNSGIYPPILLVYPPNLIFYPPLSAVYPPDFMIYPPTIKIYRFLLNCPLLPTALAEAHTTTPNKKRQHKLSFYIN